MRISKLNSADKQRRFAEHYPAHGARPIRSQSVLDGHTIFRSQVVAADDAPRVLVSGVNNSKLGRVVTVGRWKGYPIYQLTLEERATCDSGCHHWFTCYGNSMHLARRHKHGPELEAILYLELSALQAKHPRGFVIRLHVLGDFYSVGYVDCWRRWLELFPALNVFGFTARQPLAQIGAAIFRVVSDYPERFAMRWSITTLSFDETMQRRAITLKPDEELPAGSFACPAQSKNEKCCANCGACWQSQKTVAFKEHGNSFRGRVRAVA